MFLITISPLGQIPYIGLIFVLLVYYVSGLRYTLYYYTINTILGFQGLIKLVYVIKYLHNAYTNPEQFTSNIMTNIYNYIPMNEIARQNLENISLNQTAYGNWPMFLFIDFLVISFVAIILLTIRSRTRKVLRRIPKRYLSVDLHYTKSDKLYDKYIYYTKRIFRRL
jgi:hypothetical protein